MGGEVIEIDRPDEVLSAEFFGGIVGGAVEGLEFILELLHLALELGVEALAVALDVLAMAEDGVELEIELGHRGSSAWREQRAMRPKKRTSARDGANFWP